MPNFRVTTFRNQNSGLPSSVRVLKISGDLSIQVCVKISAPVLVIKIECSNCAAGLPSSVRVVQLSAHVMHSMLPSVRIGSAAYWLQC